MGNSGKAILVLCQCTTLWDQRSEHSLAHWFRDGGEPQHDPKCSDTWLATWFFEQVARWMIYASVLSMVPRSKYWLLISSSSQGKIQTLLTASIIFQPTPSTEKEQLTRQHYWFVILPQTQTQTLPIHSRTILITQGLLDSLSIEFSTNIPYLFSSMMEAHQYSGRAESSIFQCFYPALTGIMKRPAEIFAFTVRQKAILKVSISK